MPDLSEGSRAYRADAPTYDFFSRCEDAPGLVDELLRRKAGGGPALDLGCGSGKYLAALASGGGPVVGVDRSGEQLRAAAVRREGLPGVAIAQADAASLPFGDGSFRLVAACWMLGTVAEGQRRERALSEALRVTSRGGEVILVENDVGGEFERIRGRVGDQSRRTERYNAWLEGRGFEAVARFETCFRFPGTEEAASTFGAIWGRDAAARVGSAAIGHRVVVYGLGK